MYAFGILVLIALISYGTAISPRRCPESGRKCPPGQICELEVAPCLVPPCPIIERCVDIERNGKGKKNKPGDCPPDDGILGICVVYCTSDAECPGNQKCCGSCPRQCTAPF